MVFFHTALDNDGSVAVAIGDKVYTGKSGAYKSTPYVTVDGVLLKSSDYKVSYYKDSEWNRRSAANTPAAKPQCSALWRRIWNKGFSDVPEYLIVFSWINFSFTETEYHAKRQLPITFFVVQADIGG